VRAPERRTIERLDRWLRRAQETPVRDFRSFDRALRIARLPRPIRRLLWWIGMDWWGGQRAMRIGTFGVSSTAGFGASTLFVSSPCTTTLHPGALANDGTMPMRMTFDHRVYDGATAARTLVDLEAALLGEVLSELRGMSRAAA
jgi:hypothetical protein